MTIERIVEQVPYPADEIDWNRRLAVARLQRQLPGWSWDGAELPAHRPAFQSIVPVASGGFWVSREIGSQRVTDCTENPMEAGVIGESPVVRCWESDTVLDAFDADGRYLGEVEAPELMAPFQLLLHVDGARVITGAEDAEGVYRVKRYRLVLPGQERR